MEHDGRLFLCYRNGPLGTSHQIRLAELAPDLEILKDQCLLNCDSTCSYEDPRLSLLNGRLWVSYTLMPNSAMGIAEVDVADTGAWCIRQQYIMPRLAAREKNWVPLACDGQEVVWSYSLANNHDVVVFSLVRGRGYLEERMAGIGCRGTWCQARGGTNFVPWADGELLTIAHGSRKVPGTLLRHGRRYIAFPVLVSTREPYSVLASGPLLLAGEAFGGGYANNQFKAVVFPAGLICQADGKFLISLGFNDREVRFVRVDRDVLQHMLRLGVGDSPLYDLMQSNASRLTAAD